MRDVCARGNTHTNVHTRIHARYTAHLKDWGTAGSTRSSSPTETRSLNRGRRTDRRPSTCDKWEARWDSWWPILRTSLRGRKAKKHENLSCWWIRVYLNAYWWILRKNKLMSGSMQEGKPAPTAGSDCDRVVWCEAMCGTRTWLRIARGWHTSIAMSIASW